MKKESIPFILFLFVIFIFMLIVACTQRALVEIPAAPDNLRVLGLAGVAGVELRWDPVKSADDYEVTITKPAVSGSRLPSERYLTSNPYYIVTRETFGVGDFEWNVSAQNKAGTSALATGVAFTLAPDPEPEPQSNLILTLSERGAPSSGRTEIPTIYIVQNDSHKTGERFSEYASYQALNYLWGELAYQTAPLADNRQNMCVQFLIEEAGTGEAKRWPDSDTEFLLDEEGKLGFPVNDLGRNDEVDDTTHRDPEPGIDPLKPGSYYLWARAAWDSGIETAKLAFQVVEATNPIQARIILKDETGKEYGSNVCSALDEAKLIYDVSIEGGERFDELRYIFEIGQQGDSSDIVTSESATFVGSTRYATTVTYTTECEKSAILTVDGTLTVIYFDDQTATEVRTQQEFEVFTQTATFVLDMADPYAELVDYEDNLDEIMPFNYFGFEVATMVFYAEDTKCLQPYENKITFDINVDKGQGSWRETFGFFTEEVVLGKGSQWENEIVISATYSATKTEDGLDTAYATLVFNSARMDMAWVTGTMTVHDCCDTDCTINDPCVGCCGESQIAHKTDISLEPILIDNVFFSAMLDPEQLFDLEGFLYSEEGATPTIPAYPGIATITFRLADAFWYFAEGVIPSFDYLDSIIEYDFYEGSSVNPFSDLRYNDPAVLSTRTILEVCSGYATKVEVTFIGTVIVDTDEPTETILTLFIGVSESPHTKPPHQGVAPVRGDSLSDRNDLLSRDSFPLENSNFLLIKQDFLFDTIPPTLTHFAAFRDQASNESWIEFGLSQEPKTASFALRVAEAGCFTYDLTDTASIPNQDWAYRINTGVTLPFGAEITLSATSSDLAGNIGYAEKTTTVSLSDNR